jgi:hypothetical protein
MPYIGFSTEPDYPFEIKRITITDMRKMMILIEHRENVYPLIIF